MLRSSLIVLVAVASVNMGGTTTAPTTKPARTATDSEPELVASLGKGYAPCVETTARGSVDWTRGMILATGTGRVRGRGSNSVAMARRAARLHAARNAVLLVSNLPIDPAGKKPNIQDGRISVEAVMRDFEETAMEFDPSRRTVTVTLAVPLYGLSGVVRLSGVVTESRAARWSWPTTQPTPSSQGLNLIVIDTEGTGFRPVMFPRLQTAAGQRVFDAADVPTRALLTRSLVTYAARTARAKKSPLPAGLAVLTLRPTASKGNARGSLVLSEEDMAKLATHPEAKALMRSGKVIVIVGDNAD